MLSLAFAASGDEMTKECLEYATRAIGFVGKTIGNAELATADATVGAILLLAGIDVSDTHRKRKKEQESLDGVSIAAADSDECLSAVPLGEALTGPTPPQRCAAINSLL